MRDLRRLPKANLHLHLTGSMRPSTVRSLAEVNGVALGESFSETASRWWQASADRGWSTFQRQYDLARAVICTGSDLRRVLLEAAEDNAADGAEWVELQVDPTAYSKRLGGLRPALEMVLDAASAAGKRSGIGIGVVVASSWARSPQRAEALAALAAKYVNDGVVGFGLSNDERLGVVQDFAKAASIAHRAGLPCFPHSGFFTGPAHVADCVNFLGARRIGHGISAVHDKSLMNQLAVRGIALEVCLTSYEPLGVVSTLNEVPLRRLHDAGVPVAIGSDDPLLFEAGLADQYDLARHVFGFEDDELGGLARQSVQASRAPDHTKRQLLDKISAWLAKS